MENKKYIHYGHKRFDMRLFEPIRNEGLVPKPYGGFWASPVDAKWGWKDWCKRENFERHNLRTSFSFHLAPTANVLVVNNVECLESLPKMPYEGKFTPTWVALDFEKIQASGVDAIEYVLSSDGRLYMAMYGWDCDSILIMNPDIIVMEE